MCFSWDHICTRRHSNNSLLDWPGLISMGCETFEAKYCLFQSFKINSIKQIVTTETSALSRLSSCKGRQSCCAHSPQLASAKGSLVTAWCQTILWSRFPLLQNYFSCEFRSYTHLHFSFCFGVFYHLPSGDRIYTEKQLLNLWQQGAIWAWKTWPRMGQEMKKKNPMFSLWGSLSGAFHQGPVGKSKIRAGFLNAHRDLPVFFGLLMRCLCPCRHRHTWLQSHPGWQSLKTRWKQTQI